jgi:hypothetical protein
MFCLLGGAHRQGVLMPEERDVNKDHANEEAQSLEPKLAISDHVAFFEHTMM